MIIREDTEVQRYKARHKGLEQELGWGGMSFATVAMGCACHGEKSRPLFKPQKQYPSKSLIETRKRSRPF